MSAANKSGNVGSVLVVGGGIAGMQASLDLADSGFKVYLLDKSPAIGGVMAQLDKTFPTNDCAMCIMAPKLVATGRHHNTELITNADITSVTGDVGNFTVKIHKRSRRVNEEKCTGCGVCAQECPVRAISNYDERLISRTGVYVPYAQAVPLVYIIDKDICIGCGICENKCLADAIEYDQEDEEIELNVGSIVLTPGFDEYDPELKKEYGYGVYPNVVSSIEFERVLSASGPYGGVVIRPSDGEIPAKLAFIQCVGSRDEKAGVNYCSSVCCMYAMKEAIIAQEHTEGINASIFIMDMRAFGKEFDDYYERAKDEHGIIFHRARVAEVYETDDHDLVIRYVENGEVKEEIFNMVVLSVGLRPPDTAEQLAEAVGIDLNRYNFCSTSLFTPLETSKPGVFVGGAFSSPKDIPDTVAQASGVAAKASGVISDVRGTEVTPKEYPPEIDVTGVEPRIGVFICHCGINIGGVVDVPAVMEYATTLSGVVFADRNLYTCSQDTQERIKEKILEHDLNRVVVASCTPRTHEPLFRNTVQEGGLNQYLFEMANIRDQCSWAHMHQPEEATKKARDLVRMAVAKARLLEPLEQSTLGVINKGLVIGGGLSGMTAALDLAEQGFETYLVEREDELGGNLRRIHYVLDNVDPQERLQSIIKEVQSNSLIRVYTGTTIKDIGGYVGNFKTILEKDGSEEELEHGAVIVATGAEEYRPTEYLYGEDERVMTQLELEEKLAAGEKAPDNVVMIQCVGCRNDVRTYCSKVCCSEAVKNALKILELNPNASIHVLYKDIRTYGFREDAYKEAASKGVVFIRYDEENMPAVDKQDDQLQVKIYDSVSDTDLIFKPDALVLSAATIPHPDNEELAKMLKVPLSKDGFFLEAHMKLRPVDFATEGVFLAGMAHWPKFIDESISQASGAVARACTVLSKDELKAEGTISWVDEAACRGCGICVEVCPYGALDLKSVNRFGHMVDVSSVNAALCKGCGACAAACLSGAIQQKGFKDYQILAMIDAFAEEEST